MQDILPPQEKRTIRKIPLSRGGKVAPEPWMPAENNLEPNDRQNFKPPRRFSFIPKISRRKFFIFSGIALLLILILGIIGRSSAEIKITPRQLNYDLELSLKADKLGTLPFEILTAEREMEKEIPADGEEMVERPASGEIIIFNEHSTNQQILINNTRFETPEGLIFRIRESITVPGATERNGQLVPGQLKVRVYADQAGEKYNIGLTDFTIPGFKGLPQYQKFYARSATPMSGGFVGQVKKVSENLADTTKKELRNLLQNSLREELAKNVPAGFIVPATTIKISYESLPNIDGATSVKIREKGVASGVMFEKSVLESIIASEVLSETAVIEITNLDKLAYVVSDASLAEKWENIESFDFQIKGRGNFIWVINQSEVKNALAGKNKNGIKDYLRDFNSIEQAEAVVNPFWKRSFPKNPEKIKLEITATP